MASTTPWSGATRAIAAATLLWASCGNPERNDAGSDGADACSDAACASACRGPNVCNASCVEGACICMPCAGDADSGDDAEADVARRDDGADGTADGDDGGYDASACELRSTGETRPGASPGVTCTRVSVQEVEEGLLAFSGDDGMLALTGRTVGGSERPGLWVFDRSIGCLRVLDSLDDVSGESAYAFFASVDRGRIVYSVTWRDGTTQHCQLRLLDLRTREKRVLDEGWGSMADCGHGNCGCGMDYPALEYPWVVWRDIREDDGHPGIGWNWYAYAMNVETGEKINLSLDPTNPDPSQRYWDAIRVDFLGTLAVWAGSTVDGVRVAVSVDVASRERRVLARAENDREFATITPEWIAWVDWRGCPEFWGDCSADIYGYDRLTGEEHALVVAGDTYQGNEVDGEGPWLAYEDQRGGADPTRQADREQDIFALHLPTMTEIRITDWPGYEEIPRVYTRGDGTLGVLLVQEISYMGSWYRLWDCDLPEPEPGP